MRITKAQLELMIHELRMENEKLRMENGELEANAVNLRELMSLRLGAQKFCDYKDFRSFTVKSLTQLLRDRVDSKSPNFEEQLARFLEESLFKHIHSVGGWPE